jgi:ubiquinone/menaquinone biosynthesis C-methylase UbiE
MTGEFSSTWLALREPADAAARAADLVHRLDVEPPLVIRDLGCGTGSLSRWLAPRLPGPQHWILMDTDPDLLASAAAGLPETVTVETVRGDVTALTGDDLAGTSLVTCSALLDLLTADEVDALAAVCAVHRTPALSVVGEVAFDPPDPLDATIAAAFNAHQRRTVGGRRLLGPESATTAEAAFRRHGATVEIRPSPWRLASDSALAGEWLKGWVSAAQDQSPDLDPGYYVLRRLGDGASVTVGHADLLATFH